MPLGGAQRRKAHCCWRRNLRRCIGACVHTVGGHRRDHSDSDTTPVDLVGVEAGACCDLSTEPIINPERIGFSALRLAIGLHYGKVLLDGITRHQWATYRVPGRHRTRGLADINDIIAQFESTSCIVLHDHPLLADQSDRCAERILIDIGTGCSASSNGSRPAAGCCASLVVCVAHTVEGRGHRIAPCHC